MLETREPVQELNGAGRLAVPAPPRAPGPVVGNGGGMVHAWALLTATATFVLLGLGSVVTTLQVGMADPIWPTYPWHLMLIDWREPSAGFLIEHAHRLAGYVVGCCVIVLATALWRCERRRWLCWLGTAALGAVTVQGLLGGFRVRLHALLGTDLAAIHGCFAQLVFALVCSLALFTSRRWTEPATTRESDEARGRLRRAVYITAALVYVQIVLGALVRHAYSPLGQRLHLFVAFGVVAAVAWLARSLPSEGSRWLAKYVRLLVILVVLQLMLGIETWISRYSSGTLPELQRATLSQGLLRTGHFLVGTLIFATSVLTALVACHSAPGRAAGSEGVA